jgi:hypothetical protein
VNPFVGVTWVYLFSAVAAAPRDWDNINSAKVATHKQDRVASIRFEHGCDLQKGGNASPVPR